MNWHSFEQAIKGKGIPVFSVADIRTLCGVTNVAANFLVQRYAKKGFIIRLKKGLYAFPNALPSDLTLANALYGPSYVSLEFALAYHGVIPDVVYEITSVTTKATRRFAVTAIGKVFSYRKIKKSAYTGYTLQQAHGSRFHIADAEKALVDAQYLRLCARQQPLARFRTEKINRARALRYAALFGNRALVGVLKATLT